MAKKKRSKKYKNIYIPADKSYAIYHIFSSNTRNGMIRISDYNPSTGFVEMTRIAGDLPDFDDVKELCYNIYGNSENINNN